MFWFISETLLRHIKLCSGLFLIVSGIKNYIPGDIYNSCGQNNIVVMIYLIWIALIYLIWITTLFFSTRIKSLFKKK